MLAQLRTFSLLTIEAQPVDGTTRISRPVPAPVQPQRATPLRIFTPDKTGVLQNHDSDRKREMA